MLQGAAAARLEVRTGRDDALGARTYDLQQFGPPFFGLQSDSFPRQGEGCEHGLAVGGAAKAVSLRPHGRNLGLERADLGWDKLYLRQGTTAPF
jgi:hypothetical protein